MLFLKVAYQVMHVLVTKTMAWVSYPVRQHLHTEYVPFKKGSFACYCKHPLVRTRISKFNIFPFLKQGMAIQLTTLLSQFASKTWQLVGGQYVTALCLCT